MTRSTRADVGVATSAKPACRRMGSPSAVARPRRLMSESAARWSHMLRAFAITGLALLALAGCTTTKKQPGSPDVYQEIAAMTVCGDLQRWFDTVMDNAEAGEPGDLMRDISLSYADASIERMDDLDCG